MMTLVYDNLMMCVIIENVFVYANVTYCLSVCLSVCLLMLLVWARVCIFSNHACLFVFIAILLLLMHSMTSYLVSMNCTMHACPTYIRTHASQEVLVVT